MQRTALADPTRRLDLLLSPDGQALLTRLCGEPLAAERELRLAKQLRKQYPPELVTAVLGLVELRQRGRAKFERASEMYFTRSGLEQASSEAMAEHHARRYALFGSVADLCCGIGGDLLALAAGASVVAVDHDDAHLAMAGLNARVYGVESHMRSVQADVREVDLGNVEAVFIDPARRVGYQRLRAGLSEPPLEWCLLLARDVSAVGIKAAPGLPLELVPEGWEVEFVADGRDLKEALLWSPRLATAERRATVLPHGETLVGAAGPPVALATPGAYLLDPSPAITRAGLVEELARSLGAWQIDRQVAFLSSDQPLRTPFGRCLHVVASLPWNLKPLRRVLRDLNVGVVDIRKRGSAVDVADLQRRLKLHGDRAATVVLTRVLNRPWALVCE